jgi:proline dehydrogenase
MNEALEKGACALRKAALNVHAKEYILGNPILFTTMKKAANRYIGGETLEETVTKVQQQNQQGFACSMEFMGESTLTIAESSAATQEFIRITQQIKALGLRSAVSLDLSHIGLAISKNLCLENLDAICREAQSANSEVMISAEGVERTDDVLDVYLSTAPKYANLGITLQSYLYRTKDDVKEAVKQPGRIRIVKGAFETPAGHAMPRGSQLDEVYLQYVDQLLASQHKCSIATHHGALQQAAAALIAKHKADRSLYEFESLYGIQNDQLAALKEQGHPAKVYFVYGKEWYLYVCNRIAEHPLNIFQALEDIVTSPR